jgi:hypothetical protein
MGRTVPTMTQIIQREEESWAPFRRALRAQDRPAFDRLFAAARRYAAAASYVARPVPFDALLLSMLLEAMLSIEHLEREVDRLRARLPGPADPPDASPPAEASRGPGLLQLPLPSADS